MSINMDIVAWIKKSRGSLSAPPAWVKRVAVVLKIRYG